MFRCILAALAAVVLLTASLMPDDAYARRGGGINIDIDATDVQGGGLLPPLLMMWQWVGRHGTPLHLRTMCWPASFHRNGY